MLITIIFFLTIAVKLQTQRQCKHLANNCHKTIKCHIHCILPSYQYFLSQSFPRAVVWKQMMVICIFLDKKMQILILENNLKTI